MASVNKVILIGNLGKDPEVRYSASGTAVANFTLATTDRYGEEDRTEWHRIVAFGRVAEICGEYLSKGRQIYIEGRIQTRDWEDRDGNKRYTTEIVVNNMQMLGPPPGGGGSRGRDSWQDQPRQGGGQSGGQGGYGGRQDRGSAPARQRSAPPAQEKPSGGYGEPSAPPNNTNDGNWGDGGPPSDDEIPF